MKIDAEIQIQRSLSHANIVKLLHNFEDNVKICLVLELCERKSLTSLLKLHGQVTFIIKALLNLHFWGPMISYMNVFYKMFTKNFLGTSKRGVGDCSSNHAGFAIHTQQGYCPS